MASQVLGAASNQQPNGQPSPGQPSPGRPVTKRAARFWPGPRMLVLGIVVLLAGWRWPCRQVTAMAVSRRR
jgi:hypothetical protein